MAGFRLVYSAIKGEFAQAMADIQKPIATAATATMKDVADFAKTQGRAAISAGGFGNKWQSSLRTKTYPLKGVSIDAATFIFHKIPYAGVFEDGAHIAGSPLLWLPLPSAPPRIGSRKMTARNFVQLIGPLVTMRVAGRRPMLGGYIPASSRGGGKITIAKLRRGQAQRRARGISKRAGTGADLRGVQLVPLFIGLEAVDLRKRFDLRGVFNRAQQSIGKFYLSHIGG